ncbi:Cyclic nucleotide-binding domain-containing protein [Tenacibaculum sp. 190524A02b]|uniref:Cyclic nucleotide-binding domain-containing protein n=1 Tax=Tenacibaculum vairaonense TaxID=3137860 RepID=A0ABM9PSD6_9FLAO
MKNTIVSIFKELPLTEETLSDIQESFLEVNYKKGATILRSGEQVQHQYYVIKGCLRAFFIDDKGKEHTIQFAISDWWISDYIGYFSKEKSVLTIECIEEATLLKIAKKDIENIYANYPQIESFFRKKIEKSIVRFEKRILANLSQTAKERYLSFTKTYPNIEKHVKNYHIASYLGITTESLSRIRKEIATNK